MSTPLAAQSSDPILLPTVEVETTEQPIQPTKTARAPAKAKPAPRRGTQPRKVTPTVCTPTLAGTAVCAEQEAAEREAQRASEAQRLAETKAAAGGSS